jgi:hypothetical protein
MLAYQGGKQRLKKDICPLLENAFDPQTHSQYLEPFVGMGSVMLDMKDRLSPYPNITFSAGDYDPDVIALWHGAQSGWVPPTECPSKYEWSQFKEVLDPQPDQLSPLRSMSLIGLGYSGQKGMGYFPERWPTRVKTFTKAQPNTQNIQVVCRPFQEWNPHNSLIYCDPPYGNVWNSRYGNRKGWRAKSIQDWWALLWSMMHKWASDPTNTVMVSWSIAAPLPDGIPHEIVWDKEVKRSTRSTKYRPDLTTIATEQLIHIL